jgi:hypothetical protein
MGFKIFKIKTQFKLELESCSLTGIWIRLFWAAFKESYQGEWEGLAGHVEWMKYTHRVLVGKPYGKRAFRRQKGG